MSTRRMGLVIPSEARDLHFQAVGGCRSLVASLLGMTGEVVLAAMLTACTSVPNATPPQPVAVCVVGIAESNARDTLSLATSAPVDWAHVPVATNAAERLAFAQLYETLIDVDCEGRARRALAVSWTLDPTRTRVTLSLRHDALFWSGKPVTAGDVVAAWRRTAAESIPGARLARELAAGTTVIDEHTLIVSLPDTAWMVLASPTLAIYEQQATAPWPEGSGPYRIVEQSTPGTFLLMPIASQSAPYLLSRRIPSGDPRDAIDAGSDVLVTDDPVAVGYAASRANLVVVPLPWSRTYALAIPTPKVFTRLVQPDSASLALRESLARDAVRVQARAAQSPFWWDASSVCKPTPDAVPRSAANQQTNRVVYRREDRVARGLADRVVALDSRSVAAGLGPDNFDRALHNGSELAYVLDLPRASLSSCRDVGELWSAAPWIASGVASDAKLVPLIDTRETAILNRQRASATVDWSGTLHFSRP